MTSAGGWRPKASCWAAVCNTERFHESLRNMTPEDVYLGRDRHIQTARERLKRQTLRRRKRYNQGKPLPEEALIRPSLWGRRQLHARIREQLLRPGRAFKLGVDQEHMEVVP